MFFLFMFYEDECKILSLKCCKEGLNFTINGEYAEELKRLIKLEIV